VRARDVTPLQELVDENVKDDRGVHGPCGRWDDGAVDPLLDLGLKDSYGFGLAVGRDFFGHGGAYSTNTTADTGRGLIFVWLVQHAGFPGQGGKAEGAFRTAAIETFAQRTAATAPGR
jgi:hypothetical protein